MTVTWKATPAAVSRVINAVLAHASTNTDLPVINAVRLELDGDRLLAVATDRYTIAICRASLTDWDDKAKKVKPQAGSLRSADVKRVLDFLKPHRKDVATWKLTDTSLTVTVSGASLTVPTADENFPNWRIVLGSVLDHAPEPGQQMGFTPRIVSHFQRSADALGELAMTWQFVSLLKPVIVRIGDEFLGLLMPCRLPDDAPALDPAAFGIATTKAVAA